jgi:hypothetical protein
MTIDGSIQNARVKLLTEKADRDKDSTKLSTVDRDRPGDGIYVQETEHQDDIDHKTEAMAEDLVKECCGSRA